MKTIVSDEDRRLLRRAGALFAYLWSAMEVLFVAGIILPSVNAGGSALAGSTGFLGPGILASLVFAGLLAGASMFLPEKPFPAYARVLRGFLGLGLGVVAASTSAAVLLAPPFHNLAGSADFWVLVVVVLLNCILGLLMLLSGLRDLQATLFNPVRPAP